MSPAFERHVRLPVPAAQALAWHEREGVPERLSPPWRSVQPQAFARWQYARVLHPEGEGCVLVDRVDWELPLAPVSRAASGLVERALGALFAWRHRVTRLDLGRVKARAASGARTIGITGASGFLGRALSAYLSTQGHRVVRFVRRPAREGEIAWDPARGTLDTGALAPLDAVVHLAGAGVADSRWSAARKRELVESRVASTATLARALATAPPRARALVSASAIGWYGDRGDELLDESSAPGTGFLAELARAWEGAADPARAAGVRVAHPRIGLVLWPLAGALEKLVPPFRMGVGGPLGNGRQWWSWITLHDLLDLLLRAVEDDGLHGPFNAVAPEPIRQRDFAAAVGAALSRPSWLPAPAFALRALLGAEQADGMLLAGQRVRPAVLEQRDHAYRDPDLRGALQRLFGRVRDDA